MIQGCHHLSRYQGNDEQQRQTTTDIMGDADDLDVLVFQCSYEPNLVTDIERNARC